MLVSTLSEGHKVTGLRVRPYDARRYFPKNITEIELQLDHLRIKCGLALHFWGDKPEISDPRLSLWLESKDRNSQGCHGPLTLAMIPSGENSFVVGPTQLEDVQKSKHSTRWHIKRGDADEARSSNRGSGKPCD
jgi:hypothetical protein